MSDGYIIWHNPRCSTSRFVLNALREAGLDPVVRDYQKDPPSQAELRDLLAVSGLEARDLLRSKDAPDEVRAQDGDALLATLADVPKLVERPVVFTPKGAWLCRPKEKVFDLLPKGTGN